MASMMVGIMKDWWRARGWLISGRIHVCWTCADRQSHAYCIVSSPTYQDKVHQRVQFIQHCVHGLPAPLRDTWGKRGGTHHRRRLPSIPILACNPQANHTYDSCIMIQAMGGRGVGSSSPGRRGMTSGAFVLLCVCLGATPAAAFVPRTPPGSSSDTRRVEGDRSATTIPLTASPLLDQVGCITRALLPCPHGQKPGLYHLFVC